MTGYDEQALARWVIEEPKSSGAGTRSAFARDRARVLHASAFRRLAGKTQVVHPEESDFPRTRLTHSLECAQIGREIAAALQADPDLVDAACLAHDLGHPPFGHNGELALDEIASGATGLVDCGGFEGNAQSLRLLSRLEMKVPGAGLNLTRASLDAATKYPWFRPAAGGKFGVYADDAEVYAWFRQGSDPSRQPIETQIMDWADDVAYSVHDYEDGVQARQIDPARLDAGAIVYTARVTYLPAADAGELRDTFRELTRQPWWVGNYDGSPQASAALKAMTSELIGRFSAAAIRATRRAAGDEPLRRYTADIVVPAGQRMECALLKGIAAHYVMLPRRSAQERQRELLVELADAVLARAPESLDPLLQPAWAEAGNDAGRLRVVVDQIAGLTDAGASSLHRRLTDTEARSQP